MSSEAEGFRFDKHISLGHLITTIVVLAGAVTGYVRLENVAVHNAKAIAELQRKTELNRAFQIHQRERVWERVNSVQAQANELRSDVAALSAKSDYIARQLDRLVERLIDDARRVERRGDAGSRRIVR